jgi:predicted nucleotidyltransferase
LAEILAEWINPAPGIPAVYLFGSGVRGDHRPNSDVDVRLGCILTKERRW